MTFPFKYFYQSPRDRKGKREMHPKPATRGRICRTYSFFWRDGAQCDDLLLFRPVLCSPTEVVKCRSNQSRCRLPGEDLISEDRERPGGRPEVFILGSEAHTIRPSSSCLACPLSSPLLWNCSRHKQSRRQFAAASDVYHDSHRNQRRPRTHMGLLHGGFRLAKVRCRGMKLFPGRSNADAVARRWYSCVR